MRSLAVTLCSVGLILYPLLVYSFVGAERPQLLVAALAILLAIRLFATALASKEALLGAFLLLCVFCALALLDTQLRILRLYPVLISLGGAGYCLYTLLNPPSAIERFARRVGMNIPIQANAYLRGVTIVWLTYFGINAMIAAYTALAADVSTWAWYNGLISYLIVGVLLLGEWLYRQRYQRLHPEPPVS